MGGDMCKIEDMDGMIESENVMFFQISHGAFR